MEDIKENKVVSMNPERLSYDKLKGMYEDLRIEKNKYEAISKQLMLRLNTVDNMFKRLDYLFKVVENGDKFSIDFLNRCSEEIEALLTVPDNEEEEDKEELKE